MRTYTEASGVGRASAPGRELRQLAWIAIAAGTLGCLDSAGPPPLVRGATSTSPVTFVAAVAPGSVDALPVVYVSLAHGSIPNGAEASLRVERTGAVVSTPLIDGGFDPVGVLASVGDIITVEVRDANGERSAADRVPVKPETPPVIVRTVPPPHKRDVPLNNLIAVVFSEPIDRGALATAAIQLRTGGVVVEGGLQFLDDTRTAIAFVLAVPLLASTDYELVITQAIRDASGTPLAEPMYVPFRTATAATSPTALIVSPGSAGMLPTEARQLGAVATDAAGNVLSGRTITWSSNMPSVATVDATGLVTGVSPGGPVIITARSGSVAGGATIRVSGPPGPPAGSLELWTESTGEGTGGVQRSPRGTDCSVSASIRGTCSLHPRGAKVTLTATPALNGRFREWRGSCFGAAPTCEVTMDESRTVGVYFDVLTSVHLFGSISLGSANHACALEAQTGLAYCWGDNHAGALGVGARAGAEIPVAVTQSRRYSSISVASYSTCALEQGTGFAYCWGSNAQGALGDGVGLTRWEPMLVGGGSRRFSTITSGGMVSCGVEAGTGIGFCWGKAGLVGDGSVSQTSTPTQVAGDVRFSEIRADDEHVCGLEAETGLAYCWGENDRGQLGDGTTTDRLAPALVGAGSRRFSRIDVGRQFTCGVEALTGLVFCWGRNDSGQLGDATTTDRWTPTPVSGPGLRFASVDATADLACGIEAGTGMGYCWGRNDVGQVGDGTTAERRVPTLVGGGSPRFGSINAGLNLACGVEEGTGRGYCWANNHTGSPPGRLPTPLFPPSGPGTETSSVMSDRMR